MRCVRCRAGSTRARRRCRPGRAPRTSRRHRGRRCAGSRPVPIRSNEPCPPRSPSWNTTSRALKLVRRAAPHHRTPVVVGQLIEDRLGHGPKYCPIMADGADPTGPDWDREATATSLAALRADTRAKSVSFAVLRDDVLEYVAADGPGADAILGTRMPVTNGFAGYCASSGQSIEVADPQRDARFGRDVAERTGIMPARLLVVPVQCTGHTIGVVTVIDRDLSVARAIDRAAVDRDRDRRRSSTPSATTKISTASSPTSGAGSDRVERARALDFLERLDVEPPDDEERPAWSEAFEPDRLPSVTVPRVLTPISRDAAFGHSTRRRRTRRGARQRDRRDSSQRRRDPGFGCVRTRSRSARRRRRCSRTSPAT